MHQIAIDIYLHAFFMVEASNTLSCRVVSSIMTRTFTFVRRFVPGDGLGDIVGKLPFPAGMRMILSKSR